MFDKVVSFGCSWTYGDELPEETRISNSFTGLIAKHFGAEPEIYAEKGASQNTTRNLFLRYLYQKPHDYSKTLFLIGLTYSSRWSWTVGNQCEPSNNEHVLFNPSIESIDMRIGYDHRDWKKMYELHYKLSHSEFLDKINYQTSTMFFDGIACRHKLNLLQFDVYENNQNYIFLDTPTMYKTTPLDDLLADRWECRAPDKHPNEKGHRIIADNLIEELERRYG